MLFKKDRKILNQKSMRHNRDILIKDMEEQVKVLHEENKNLRFEIEEQRDLISRIERLVNSNKYNNEKAIFSKIKELISDYQSQN